MVTLRVAHDRVKSWLAAQVDGGLAQDQVNHVEVTGTISPTADPHTPFTADERDRFDGVGVEIRICGNRLFSMLVPDADRLVGRLGGPNFRARALGHHHGYRDPALERRSREQPGVGHLRPAQRHTGGAQKLAGGGCLLTTAVASRRVQAGDGPTLTVLREFQNGRLRRLPDGQELAWRNKLSGRNMLQVGMCLKLPGRKASTRTPSQSVQACTGYAVKKSDRKLGDVARSPPWATAAAGRKSPG